MNFVRNDRQPEQTGSETFLSLHYHQKEVDPYIITRKLSSSTNNGHQMRHAGDHVERTGNLFHNGTYSGTGTRYPTPCSRPAMRVIDTPVHFALHDETHSLSEEEMWMWDREERKAFSGKPVCDAIRMCICPSHCDASLPWQLCLDVHSSDNHKSRVSFINILCVSSLPCTDIPAYHETHQLQSIASWSKFRL